MLRSINKILNYSIMAVDGEIGKCNDFLFEDRPWVIRYMVANTGNWLLSRKVLLSLLALENPDWETNLFHVNLTKRQVEESPPLKSDEPVSRQYEKESFLYYGWPAYWEHSVQETQETESKLRSVKEVTGYFVQGVDEKIGSIVDFIVDDQIWAIRYIVVQAQGTKGEKEILAAPEWVSYVDWLNQSVHIDITAELIENCPAYDPTDPLNREYETILYDYYDRPYYWAPESR